MNIIELAQEVGITSPDGFKLTVNPVQIDKLQAFANAVIKAHTEELIEGVVKPVAWMHENAVGLTYYRKHRQGGEFNPVGLYTAAQVAGAVAKSNESAYQRGHLDGYLDGIGRGINGLTAPVQQEPIQVSKVYWEGDKLMAVPARATIASAEVGFNGLTQEETNNSMSVRGLSK